MPFWFALVAVVVDRVRHAPDIFGRYCYAIGSNAEAARLSGVPVTADPPRDLRRQRAARGFRRHPVGRVSAGRVAGARVTPGSCYAVAAAVLGGCSLQGGRGSVFGVLVGAGVWHLTFNSVNLVL